MTAEELAPGAKGLKRQTRPNGAVVQETSTTDMAFDVATLIANLSEAIMVKRSDVIVPARRPASAWGASPWFIQGGRRLGTRPIRVVIPEGRA